MEPYNNFLTSSIRVSLQDIPSIMLKHFMEACHTGNVLAVKSCLADSSFEPNELTNSGRLERHGHNIISTGFIEACYDGQRDIVSLLLQDSRIDVNKGDKYEKTGFMHACSNGHREIVRLLLQDSRVDVSKGDSLGMTGFMICMLEWTYRYSEIIITRFTN